MATFSEERALSRSLDRWGSPDMVEAKGSCVKAVARRGGYEEDPGPNGMSVHLVIAYLVQLNPFGKENYWIRADHPKSFLPLLITGVLVCLQSCLLSAWPYRSLRRKCILARL